MEFQTSQQWVVFPHLFLQSNVGGKKYIYMQSNRLNITDCTKIHGVL